MADLPTGTTFRIVHGETCNRVKEAKEAPAQPASVDASCWACGSKISPTPDRKRPPAKAWHKHKARPAGYITVCISLAPSELDEIDAFCSENKINRSRLLVGAALNHISEE